MYYSPALRICNTVGNLSASVNYLECDTNIKKYFLTFVEQNNQ
jgi:hypothetical protein